MPKSKIGIDVAHDFAPSYAIPAKAVPVVANLRALAKKADRVILATDEDREGEAIAWHLVSALGLDGEKAAKKGGKATPAKPYERIAFHEITKNAIMAALEHPRALDINLVDAQQARRVLDRLVGYELSPFLWRKIRYGLSAGRVQSVAVRLVVERERFIQAFDKEEYWTIEAQFQTAERRKSAFPAVLNSINGKAMGKMGIKNDGQAQHIIEGSRARIIALQTSPLKRYAGIRLRHSPHPRFSRKRHASSASAQNRQWSSRNTCTRMGTSLT